MKFLWHQDWPVKYLSRLERSSLFKRCIYWVLVHIWPKFDFLTSAVKEKLVTHPLTYRHRVLSDILLAKAYRRVITHQIRSNLHWGKIWKGWESVGGKVCFSGLPHHWPSNHQQLLLLEKKIIFFSTKSCCSPCCFLFLQKEFNFCLLPTRKRGAPWACDLVILLSASLTNTLPAYHLIIK